MTIKVCCTIQQILMRKDICTYFTAQKIQFSIKDFFSKCNRKTSILVQYLFKKSLISKKIMQFFESTFKIKIMFGSLYFANVTPQRFSALGTCFYQNENFQSRPAIMRFQFDIYIKRRK